jgi:hypothetical protein
MGLDLFERATRFRADRESPRSGKRDERIEHGQSSGALKKVIRSRKEANLDPIDTQKTLCTNAELEKIAMHMCHASSRLKTV